MLSFVWSMCLGKKKVASYESIHETKPNVNLLVISLLICIWIVPCVLFESWDIYVKLKIDFFVNYILFYHITFFICLNKLSTWTYMWLLYDIPLKFLRALLYTLRTVFPIYVSITTRWRRSIYVTMGTLRRRLCFWKLWY